ncbi:MAG: cell division protein FtsQ/DivIB [Chromatiales bacterium]|nr:cell division protein FtsQ/DivIB [Chromatiales bacterium]
MARRKAAQRERRSIENALRRRLWRGLRLSLGYLVLAIGIGWGAALALGTLERPDVLPVQVVRIATPLLHADPAELQTELAPLAATGLFAADVAAIRSAAEASPWIAEATVRRRWPATLEVFVRERQPVAYWGEDALVGRDGVVFRPAVVDGFDLPRLIGPDDSAAAEMVQMLADVQSRLAPLGLEVVVLERNARRAWRLALANGAVIEIGSADVANRIERFARTWPQLATAPVGAAGVVAVDLRYPNGLAVRLAPAQTEAGG